MDHRLSGGWMDVGNHLPEIYHKVEVVQTDLEIFQWSNSDGLVCVWGGGLADEQSFLGQMKGSKNHLSETSNANAHKIACLGNCTLLDAEMTYRCPWVRAAAPACSFVASIPIAAWKWRQRGVDNKYKL
jgi:hypothetical protein